MVFSGFVTAWRFATCPARRSPLFVNATTDGVVRPPSWLGITTGCPPSITATTELVVPRSIPMILLILLQSSLDNCLQTINSAGRAVRQLPLPGAVSALFYYQTL